MAYNRHFILKRKTIKNNQTNTSANIPNLTSTVANVNRAIPGKRVFNEARKTGLLDLTGFGLYEIPLEIFHINDASKDLKGFDDDENLNWWENTFLYKLVLPSNNLKSISEDIRLLYNLKHLDLSKNELTELPKEIEELTMLEYLNVAENKLTYLPERIGTLVKLQHLNIADNKIKFLPSGFCRLLNLELLDISGNNILHVPTAIFKFINLKYLNMAKNRLTTLPEELANLKELTHFDLSTNRISKIPGDIGFCFEILNYSNNNLTRFPVQKYHPSLQYIDVSNNEISEFNARHISFIPNISKLLLSKNRVEEIPKEIMNLKCLMHFDVSYNFLNSVPYELGSMLTLQIFAMEGNPLRAINTTMMRKGTDALKKYMRLRNANHTEVETEITEPVDVNDNCNIDESDMSIATRATAAFHVDAYKLNSMGLVDLSNRNLTTVPLELFQVLKSKRVVTVDCSNNRLSAFPVGIASFAHSMRRLVLANNRITDMPDIFSNFKTLEHLNLKSNCLRDLPMSFSFMKHSLNHMDLSNNPFGDQLPDCLFKLVHLSVLVLSHCSIANIDAAKFQQLINLHSLDLSDNQIEKIPPKFGFCLSIKDVNLDNNRIKQPLQCVIQYGTEALMRYLRSMATNLEMNNTSF